MTIKKTLSLVILLLVALVFCVRDIHAQQKKGDIEITGSSSSGFNVSFSSFSSHSVGGLSFSNSFNQQSFNITGDAGYFLTHRHEVGGGLGLSVTHFKSCSKTFMDGTLISEGCTSDTFAGLGLDAFYRYNIAKPDARGFPFVGVSASVASVTQNFTGNFSARPHAGYKYFLKKNIALDVSVGFRFDINQVDDEGFFPEDRRKAIDGRLGLSFVF